jgi:hypothetical protein
MLLVVVLGGFLSQCMFFRNWTSGMTSTASTVPRLHEGCRSAGDCGKDQVCKEWSTRSGQKNQTCELNCTQDTDCPGGAFCLKGGEDVPTWVCLER